MPNMNPNENHDSMDQDQGQTEQTEPAAPAPEGGDLCTYTEEGGEGEQTDRVDVGDQLSLEESEAMLDIILGSDEGGDDEPEDQGDDLIEAPIGEDQIEEPLF